MPRAPAGGGAAVALTGADESCPGQGWPGHVRIAGQRVERHMIGRNKGAKARAHCANLLTLRALDGVHAPGGCAQGSWTTRTVPTMDLLRRWRRRWAARCSSCISWAYTMPIMHIVITRADNGVAGKRRRCRAVSPADDTCSKAEVHKELHGPMAMAAPLIGCGAAIFMAAVLFSRRERRSAARSQSAFLCSSE